MNTPKSDKHPGEKPHPHEKKRTEIETPIDEELPRSTAEEEKYARRETRRDERYVDTAAPYRSDADRALGPAGDTVKTGIAGSLKGIDEIESDIVSLVRNTVSNTLRATGAVGTEAVDVTRTTVNAAAQGIGDIGTTAITSVRDILVSVVEGIKDVAGSALPRSYHMDHRTPPEDRVPPGEYTPPPDRTRPPEYVPPANNKEPV
ncbi:hypothetical protein [Nitrosovibrio sp. Nv6]|uniref:hypothetical protein n=1 Tax=Nitrosovibrio sp. Nv6 TaxID=1855340 RepID=UPI0008D6D479|nr:hypothetical protein [Nitrosovibrio sp. Nv6]SEO44237.1 hypothetical protein SAMN05216316_0223 [Nitrosovibrio sp. Nv6]